MAFFSTTLLPFTKSVANYLPRIMQHQAAVAAVKTGKLSDTAWADCGGSIAKGTDYDYFIA
jgi:hypothetical protein